jgi:hypothetical protein
MIDIIQNLEVHKVVVHVVLFHKTQGPNFEIITEIVS